MSITTSKQSNVVGRGEQKRSPDRAVIIFWGAALLLVIAAVIMRLYQLGLPFDRDGYDEGVYWQTLRAMGAGYALYQPTFYSQPPFFLLSTFPFYALLGSSLWSARLGIALVSLLGLPGAFLLGKALSGRLGAIAALLLLVVNPLYLAQSQTLQAEAPFVAFSLLAVGLACCWWERPAGKMGLALAALTGLTLALSIACKLLPAPVIPIAFLMVARIWVVWRMEKGQAEARRHTIYSILIGALVCILMLALVLLPFLGSLHELIAGMVTFHIDAGNVLANEAQLGQQKNLHTLETALLSFLALAALYGTIAALLRRDWRVLPLLAWLLGTLYLLWHQVPLFPHHLVTLVPPFIGLAVMGIAEPVASMKLLNRSNAAAIGQLATWLALLLVLLTAVLNVRDDRAYYRTAQANGSGGLALQEARIAADLRRAITPDQWVVTDAQFIAGLADRNTPPALVDTSSVRIQSSYLTLSELESIAADPRVHAVLFFSGRLTLAQVAPFHDWVAQHFHLLQSYGGGIELWGR